MTIDLEGMNLFRPVGCFGLSLDACGNFSKYARRTLSIVTWETLGYESSGWLQKTYGWLQKAYGLLKKKPMDGSKKKPMDGSKKSLWMAQKKAYGWLKK